MWSGCSCARILSARAWTLLWKLTGNGFVQGDKIYPRCAPAAQTLSFSSLCWWEGERSTLSPALPLLSLCALHKAAGLKGCDEIAHSWLAAHSRCDHHLNLKAHTCPLTKRSARCDLQDGHALEYLFSVKMTIPLSCDVKGLTKAKFRNNMMLMYYIKFFLLITRTWI